MARNAEKAMTALARWRRMKLEEERGPVDRRPAVASECNDLRKAEKWRLDVIREIAKKIAQIQNPGLGEYKIRDVNDEINKLLRTKYQWEVRIRELGGPDYKRIAPKVLDRDGREIPGNRGYKYFGAAKDLPGVRELFEKPSSEPEKKSRSELVRSIDASYYGYLDDDDGVLIPLEAEAEKEAVAKAILEWKNDKKAQSQGKSSASGLDVSENVETYLAPFRQTADDEISPVTYTPSISEGMDKPFITPINVPSQKEVEELILQRRKMELLKKYASDALLEQCQTARTLIGYDAEDSK